MTKSLTLVCLFLLCIAGIKAQTYCYHGYKKYDKNDIPEQWNSYTYITVKGDMIYESKKDGSYTTFSDGTPTKQIYKYTGKKIDGAKLYAFWADWWERFEYHKYYLISEDWSEINYVWTGIIDGKYHGEAFTLCYELCPFADCDKTTVPGMKH